MVLVEGPGCEFTDSVTVCADGLELDKVMVTGPDSVKVCVEGCDKVEVTGAASVTVCADADADLMMVSVGAVPDLITVSDCTTVAVEAEPD